MTLDRKDYKSAIPQLESRLQQLEKVGRELTNKFDDIAHQTQLQAAEAEKKEAALDYQIGSVTVVTEYQLCADGFDPVETGWSTTMPSITYQSYNGKTLWARSVTYQNDVAIRKTAPQKVELMDGLYTFVNSASGNAGWTMIDGDFIQTGKIASTNGYSYFDIDNNAFQMKDSYDVAHSNSVLAWNNGLLYVKGKIAVGSSPTDQKYYTEMTGGGFDIVANNVTLAHIGYGQGYNKSGQLVDAPFYTLGTRATGSALGNYSLAEGVNITASGYASHAEGLGCQATSMGAHAEGDETSANGTYSHTEGMKTETRHIRGTYAAHAGGIGTVTNGSARTAIGSYNEDDLQIDTFIGDGTTNQFYTTYPADNGVNKKYDIEVTIDGVAPRSISLDFGNQITINNPIPPDGSVIKIIYPRTATAFVIGNGTSDSNRSNALTVDWDGNITINNHDSEIGHVYSASKSVAISNTTITNNTDGASLTLSAGVYIVIGQWHFDTRTTTGTTNSAIRLYRSGSSGIKAETRVMAGDSNWNSLQCTAIVELTSTETVKVCGATSRPYTTAKPTYINAVRIK